MPSLAETECAQRGWDFAASFRKQYLITPRGTPGPDGWHSQTLSGWQVHHCPALPLATLTLSDGTAIGIVLGYAIAPDGLMIEGRHKLAVSARAMAKLDRIERYIAQLAGRFVVLLAHGPQARVYPDPGCSLGPVFDPTARRVGASTLLVLDRPVIDNPDVLAAEVAEARNFYRFGHTIDAHARRARPNHYLDLSDFSQHLHWPMPEDELGFDKSKTPEFAEAIAEKLALNMAALTGRYRTGLPISGGTDSRLLLAAGVHSLPQVKSFFVYHTNWSTSIDCLLARQIANRLSLPLTVISRDAPKFKSVLTDQQFEDIKSLRMLRNGGEPDTANPESIKAMYLSPQCDLVLRGNVAEMTRAQRWVRDVFDDPHNTEYALGKLGLSQDKTGPRHGFWTDQFAQWKATLPPGAIPRIYDFMHQELWLPHANSLVYLSEPRDFPINPFNDRQLIALTLRVSPKARRHGRLVDHIMQQNLPELHDIPFAAKYIRAQKKARA